MTVLTLTLLAPHRAAEALPAPEPGTGLGRGWWIDRGHDPLQLWRSHGESAKYGGGCRTNTRRGPEGTGSSPADAEVLAVATGSGPFREMERTLSSVFGQPAAPGRAQVMPMDLYRQDESFVLHVDLPGVDPASIDVDVDDRTLTIRAERQAADQDSVQWLVRERQMGTVARQLTLGRGVATDRISASYDSGVLTLTIPVAEEAKPRKIEVARSDKQTALELGSRVGCFKAKRPAYPLGGGQRGLSGGLAASCYHPYSGWSS